MKIRKAGIDDIELILKLRMDYLYYEGEKEIISQEQEEDVKERLKIYLQKYIPCGDFIAFIGEDDGNIISTAFLSVIERPPRTAFASNLTGTIYNVFTYPEFRRKGYATKIMSAVLDEAKALNLKSVDLLATKDGIYLYEKFGFGTINYTYMVKKFIY